MIKKTYSFEKNGNQNDVYTLSNENGMEVDVLTYGGHILRISAPDKNGAFGDCLVGCKNPEDYYEKNPCTALDPAAVPGVTAVRTDQKTYPDPLSTGHAGYGYPGSAGDEYQHAGHPGAGALAVFEWPAGAAADL